MFDVYYSRSTSGDHIFARTLRIMSSGSCFIMIIAYKFMFFVGKARVTHLPVQSSGHVWILADWTKWTTLRLGLTKSNVLHIWGM